MKLFVFIKETFKLITIVYLVFILSGIYNTVSVFAENINQQNSGTGTDASCTCGCNMDSIEDCSCCNSKTARMDEQIVTCGCSIEKSDSCMPHERKSTISGTSDFVFNSQKSNNPAFKVADYFSIYTKNYFIIPDSVYHPPSVFLS